MKRQKQGLNPLYENPEFHTAMAIRGLRAIGAYMNVSAMTVLRWHRRFRGQEEPWLCLPLMLLPTGKGWGWRYQTSAALIESWMAIWCEIDAKLNRPRPPRGRTLRISVTTPVRSESDDPTGIRESSSETTKPCTCGTTTPCTAH
jgi:hypothetical protein